MGSDLAQDAIKRAALDTAARNNRALFMKDPGLQWMQPVTNDCGILARILLDVNLTLVSKGIGHFKFRRFSWSWATAIRLEECARTASFPLDNAQVVL